MFTNRFVYHERHYEAALLDGLKVLQNVRVGAKKNLGSF